MKAKSRTAESPDQVTAHCAEFIASTTFADIPGDVLHLGKKSILDALAAGIAGSVAPGSKPIRRYLGRLGCENGAAGVIGTPLTFPPRFAALANGSAMHADDFDDTWEADTPNYDGGHPSVPALASLLATAEEDGCTGAQILTAYHVGVEIACRLIDGTDIPGGARGHESSSTCGMLGATAAVSNLKGLSVDVTRNALGIAAGQAAGLLQHLGTMMKAYQVGRAAECGVVAAHLASLGFTASPISLEGPQGFFVSESGGCAKERIVGRLGRPWAFADRGIRLKPWPTGSLTHPGMTKVLDLIREHDIQPAQVAKVRIRPSAGTYNLLRHQRPKKGLEGKFSLEFCFAALLVQRKLGLADFTDEFVNRPDLQRMFDLIECAPFSDAEASASGYTPRTTFVTIELKDGRIASGRLDDGKGSLARPMSDEEVVGKFRACAEFARWPKKKTEAAIAAVQRFETIADIRELMGTLTKQ